MLAGALTQPIPWVIPRPQWRWWPEQSPRMRGVIPGWKRLWQATREQLVAKAVAVNLLTSGSATAAASPTTASVLPSANALVLVAIGLSDDFARTVSSVTGNSLTYVEMHDISYDSTFSNEAGLALYRAMGASPTSGAITINMSATTDIITWSVAEFTGVNTTGTNGSGAIVQSSTNSGTGTTATVTLAAFGSSNNRPYVFTAIHQDTAVITPETGYTELHEVAQGDAGGNDHRIETAWHSTATDTTPSSSWTGSIEWGAIAAEIKVAGTAYTRSVAGNMPAATGTVARVYKAKRSVAGNMPSATGIVARAAGVFHRTVAGNMPTATGTVGRKLSAFRALAGNMPAASGAVTRIYKAVRSVAGSMPSATGTIAAVLTQVRSVAGNMPAATGAVTRILKAKRSVAGNQPAPSGTVGRKLSAFRSVAGNMPAPSGAVTFIHRIPILMRGITGTVSIVGFTAARLIARGRTAVIPAVGLTATRLIIRGRTAIINIRGRQR